jgi:hypothetical protein
VVILQQLIQEQQKNMMELLGLLVSLNTARMTISRCRSTNSRISFWWFYYSCYRSNRRIQWNFLDNFSRKFKYIKNALAGCGTQTAALAFGGQIPPAITTATEEYNGATWTNPTGLNTARGYLSRLW